MTILEERAAADAERAVELRRRWTAAAVGLACAIASVFALLALTRYPGRPLDGVVRSVLAVLIAMALVLGARALDGPVRLRESRKGQGASSEAAAALLLWLGCFATIMAAFLVADLVARIDVAGSIASASRSGSEDRPRIDPQTVPKVGSTAQDDGGRASSGRGPSIIAGKGVPAL